METLALSLGADCPTATFSRIGDSDYPGDQTRRPTHTQESRQVTIVRLTDPHLLPELIRALVRGGCRPVMVDSRSCAVTHPDAIDAAEADAEIAFFVRAWALRHPDVVAQLSS
jgi:hypothetical protein